MIAPKVDIQTKIRRVFQQISRTPLYASHVALGAHMTEMMGWELPAVYTSVSLEVDAVRTNAGLFDISFLGRLYITGPQAPELLDRILTASASNLKVGRARYSLICNEDGGVMDDTVFYRISEWEYMVVSNAVNSEKVKRWLKKWINKKFPGGCQVRDRSNSTVQLALQGPNSAAILDRLCRLDRDKYPSGMRGFSWQNGDFQGSRVFISRTGYTGEDGFELIMDTQDARFIWSSLIEFGATLCGMEAHDILGLEAGLPHYGCEIDENTSPIDAGLERFIRSSGQFIGSNMLHLHMEQKADRKLIGLKLSGFRTPRTGDAVLINGEEIGQITNGGFSPTLDANIAMAYVHVEAAEGNAEFDVNLGSHTVRAELAARPFYLRLEDAELKKSLAKVA